MIKAIAIDDEPLALQVIQVYCDSLSNISLEKAFSDLNKAKTFLNKFPVDVIFLDIEMPNKSGIDFYKSLNIDVKVIFTTAYEKYAIEGFNVDAIDYLLKPISFERFKKAVLRVQNFKAITVDNFDANTHLSIRANYKLNRIPIDLIIYVEAMNDYVKIYIDGEKAIVARATMKNILQELPCLKFIRIHKSFIVSINYIKNISAIDVVIADRSLPIGNSYKKDLDQLFP
ncbi:LytTR family DNA-binding domain-containing protein [Cellulophaga baltica]|uniref:LytR/AlgR family response regulator transcription factor n=1 Tax=Cellulophaga baltica TaxID=76594 RepID=UPI0021488E1C|nr:LytTR family DNA-binding domain-containing protein [Cellulophaga baltica]MCR1025720.1 LytTR family DNA-binding domain-containing protein [Cellulophaga baltica]